MSSSKLPRVTVLLTVYNGLPYLAQAINSVLNQSYSDFELLIIDDGSSDGSVNYIRAAYRDPRIRLICNEQNLGQPRSLNRGLLEARGCYVARLDQDDLCLRDRLGEQVTCLEKRPDIAVVGSWVYRMDSSGRGTGEWRPRIDDYGIFLGWLVVFRLPLLHPSVMFRRDVVNGIGGYDWSFAPAEDYELWVRLAAKGYRAYVIPSPLVKYRVHDKQQSNALLEKQEKCKRQAHQGLVDTFWDGPERKALGNLLRVEQEFWNECKTVEQVCALVEALDAMLAAVEKKLVLSPREAVSLRRVVHRWVGPGIVLARKLKRLPSRLFFPAFAASCPFLIPLMRPLAGRLADCFRRMRYAATSFLYGRT